jgi:hypothetical protein
MMAQQQNTATRDDLIAYATDIVTEALKDGHIEPTALIECVLYAGKPEMLTAIRALAALDPSAQLMAISFVRGLSDEPPQHQGGRVRHLAS